MRYRIAAFRAWLLILFGRLLLFLPDAVLASFLGVSVFFAKLLGVQVDWIQNFREVRTIFEEGGEGTRIVRRMFTEGDPRRLRMIVRSLYLR